MSNDTLYGAIEAGGTKFVCGVGSAETGSIETVRIETGTPDVTLDEVAAFFADVTARHGPIAALGIASFGPLDLDPTSPRYGTITTTPKPGWQHVDLLGRVSRALGVPASIDTDVNAAALAEARAGAGVGGRTVAYTTVGTGIGVGVALDGAIRHAGGHAEAGHLLLRRHRAHAAFAGICPFHGDCLEGLASGPAIIAAWGDSFEALPADHPAWAVQADYLGQLCAVLVLTVAPDRIVLGGGVMAQPRLLDEARVRARHWLGGYVERLATPSAFEALILPPGCREAPGLIGAYLLAADAVRGG